MSYDIDAITPPGPQTVTGGSSPTVTLQFTVPTKPADETWLGADFYSTGSADLTRTGQNSRIDKSYNEEHIYKTNDYQMYRVYAGSVIAHHTSSGITDVTPSSTYGQDNGSWSNRRFDQWDGLDVQVHPFFGVKGQIWDEILTLGEGGGGTLTVTYQFFGMGHWTALFEQPQTEDYALDPSAAGPIDITNVKLTIHTEEANLDPVPIEKIVRRVAAAQYGEIAVTAWILNGILNASNPFIAIAITELSPTKSVLDAYTMAITDHPPDLDSSIGLLYTPSGNLILAYETSKGIIRYLSSHTHGLGGHDVWVNIHETGGPGSSWDNPILERMEAWQEVEGAWPSCNILQSGIAQGQTHILWADLVPDTSTTPNSKKIQLKVSFCRDNLGLEWTDETLVRDNHWIASSGTSSVDPSYEVVRTYWDESYAPSTATGNSAAIAYSHGNYVVAYKTSSSSDLYAVIANNPTDATQWADVTRRYTIAASGLVGVFKIPYLAATDKGVLELAQFISRDGGETWSAEAQNKQNTISFEPFVFAYRDWFYDVGRPAFTRCQTSYHPTQAELEAQFPAWFLARYYQGGAIVNFTCIATPGRVWYSDNGGSDYIAPDPRAPNHSWHLLDWYTEGTSDEVPPEVVVQKLMMPNFFPLNFYSEPYS